MRTDSDVAEIYEQYEQLIEEFKQTHRLWDSGRVVSESVAELRRDLQAMEDDREVLTRRIERIHRKVLCSIFSPAWMNLVIKYLGCKLLFKTK